MMSSRDGFDMEFWIRDSIYGITPTDAMVNEIVTLLEQYREELEYRIADYDEDNQSWRAYRNALWNMIPKEIDDQVDIIIINHASHVNV